ncbi:hypothetical protein KOW79_017402 [Hemibagrus wyckioides]|uniref:UDENN domain-containing protein n=1 Tax=Hemibagrus wyckioides TaxID=337641 RepID=A0A9D3NCR8_9TELE|nr:DENN/MADD domain containing 6Aa [Hemibagrus wyckioides]KAG7318928.1 hypothetical protein KOW79_017402 [Hemibagrus wyckioides]
MASQGSEEISEQTEEAEPTQDEEDLRISPAEEMPADGPGDGEPEQLLLPWDRFSAWLHCICVVGFDLELGQAVEVIYPHHSKLTEKEKMSICYLSFPDSNSGCLGDTQFCFRFRQAAGRKSSIRCFLDHFDRDAPVCLKKDQGHFYGYVYFRQVRDKTLKRGYFQKSLVLISKLPYVTFFHSLLKLIAPEYFEKQEPCLEAACNDIDRWPTPYPGKILSLPIMGVVMKLRIPTCYDKPGTSQLVQSNSSDSLVSVVLPTIHEVDLFRCFYPVFFHIQMLWELVLLGEALVVMAPSPAESSDTVLALVSCIAPLRYCSDFRPYFTIHDSEFKEYTTRTQAPPSVILGVTNPFFAKTLQHWPHIIRIGDMKQTEMAKQMKVKKLKNLKTLDSKPGVYTAYKPFLNKDEDIIKQLQKGVQQKRPSEAQNAILRRYFLELTQSFIIPLERYVASLMPLQKSISAWKSPPQLKPFVQDEFMKTLEKAGPQLTSRLKGDWIGLYRQFLKSPNFDGWFRNRRKEMMQKLEALHLEALCEEDLQLRVQKHTEVETVDLVLKLKDKLTQAEREQLPVRAGTLAKLQAHIDSIILSLPDDLQGILHKPATP